MAQDNFKSSFDKLNKKQKEAVSTIDGPVLTLAGPGTGKTQVLTLRIAQILKSTQMNPSNILCLTFTDSAAQEMRERLNSFIGISAYDVRITTFHAFTNSIIQEFSYKFGHQLNKEENSDGINLLADLTQIDDLQRLEVISKLLEEANWKHIKTLSAPLHYLNELSKMIKVMKVESIDPDKLSQECQDYIQQIEEGEIKADKTLTNKLNRSIELAVFFKLYQEELKLNRLYDYEDMINWVVKALEEDQELALINQERYQYILVDEYQDTNNSQLKLLQNLTSHFKDNPNLFVVGDPNQSIYRFQGASTKNIRDFILAYPRAAQINLTDNYRSPQILLDTTYNLISNNPDSKEFFQAKLISATGKAGEVNLTRYTHKEQETTLIAEKIKALIDSGVEPRLIAVLVRQNNQINQFTRAFDELNIPSQATKSESVINNPIIEKIIIILELLIEPCNPYLFKKSTFLLRNKIDIIDAYNLNKIGPEESYKLIEGLGTSNYEISQNTHITLRKIVDLSKKITLLPSARAIELIIKEFGILSEINLLPNRVSIIESVRSLLDDAKKYDQIDTNKWLTKIRSRKIYKLDLTAKPILYGNQDSVVVQTIHQAKGREYEYVFIPELSEKIWSKNISSLFYIPQLNSQKELVLADEIAEQRRTLYVALTRTMINCYLSVSEMDGKDKILPSRFIEELGSQLKPKYIEEKANDAVTRAERSVLPVEIKDLTDKEMAWLKETASKRPLTPTGYGTYKKCPRNYLLTQILMLPSIKEPVASYGTAVHSALEKFFNEYSIDERLPSLNRLLIPFEVALKNEILTDQEFETWSKQGIDVLTEYYSKNENNFIHAIKTEYLFQNIHFGNIPIKGKFDKIEWIDKKAKTVRVTDYKTGSVKSRNNLLGKTKDEDTTYLDQLKFYHLLSSFDPKFNLNWKIAECQIAFIDKEKRFKEERFIFTTQEIEEFKKNVQAVWQKIQNLEFDHIENKRHSCEYCGIINIGKNKKTNKLEE